MNEREERERERQREREREERERRERERAQHTSRSIQQECLARGGSTVPQNVQQVKSQTKLVQAHSSGSHQGRYTELTWV